MEQFNDLSVKHDLMKKEMREMETSLQSEILLNDEQRTHIEILKEIADKILER